MALRIRKDAWKLPPWDPAFEWYAKAVGAMQARPISDPRSWRYQAAIHDYVAAADPAPGPLPPAAHQQRYWRQCQHFCWFFLPWHRMYLFHFERIVAATIVELGGPADWALPYWNYSDDTNPNARVIPAAFRDATLPDGTPNPLRIDERDFGNDGSPVGDPSDTDVCTALRKTRFESAGQFGDPGLGGGESGFNHGRGFATIAGELERVPHGSMHVAVGGFMGAFNTAGLDPLFWLHHANIDRLWQVWRERDTANSDPAKPLWLTGVRFHFHDHAGQPVSHVSEEVVDTRAVPWEYAYDDTSNPCLEVERVRTTAERLVTERRPEMVAATTHVELGERPAVAELAMAPPSGPARTLAESRGTAPNVYLNLENITGVGQVSYGVYLNVPEGETAEQHPELFAGVLPMFGVEEASQSDTGHGGSGLHYTLDVTDLVRQLQEQGAWSPGTVRVSFVPRLRGRETARESRRPNLEVGRISIYMS